MIGTAIRDARSTARLTQAGVASRFGLSQQTISSWEHGKSKPHFWYVAQIAALVPKPGAQSLVAVAVSAGYNRAHLVKALAIARRGARA